MMTQRTATNVTTPIPSAIHNAFARPSQQASAPAAATSMRWVCEVCGMKHGTIAPNECDSCGSNSLALQKEQSTEISNRW